jgi:RHS repeat-associated protein
MLMPGRTYSASIGLAGRFGFNGQQKDNEIAGTGNSLDFGARQHDTRLARLNWSVDPLAKKFPGQSPYLFANNNPNLYVDEEGKHGVVYTQITDKQGYTTMVAVVNTYDYNVVHPPAGTLGWDQSFDYVQFASINLQTGRTEIGKPINTAYVPAWERAWRRVEGAVTALDNMSKPAHVAQTFEKYYTPGSGGIMFQMTGGQGQENRQAQFPDGNIVNIDDVVKFTGNYGGSGGIGLFANWADKLANFNAAADMTDYMGGVDNRQFNAAQQRAGATQKQVGDTMQCDVPNGCGLLHVGGQPGIPPAAGKSVSDYPKKK